MDLKKIRTLLEKYYNGESTLDEEKILREYFNSELVDNEFVADKDIFSYQIHENENIKSIPDISNEILDTIKKSDDYKNKINSNVAYFYLRIAASVIILIGSIQQKINKLEKK